jgi:hypothetical protein
MDCGILSPIYSSRHLIGLDPMFTKVALFKELFDYDINIIQKIDFMNILWYMRYYITQYFEYIEYTPYIENKSTKV